MDFLGVVFGTSALFEGLNRVVGDGLSAQDWFATKEAEAVPVKLPWETSIAEELPYERQLREAVLLISQSPQVFLQNASQEASELSADTFASAGAVLEADEGLRHLRFRLVPKFCSEEQFWNAYFARVARVKEQVKAEQMWADFDMLGEEEEEEEGQPHAGTAGTAGSSQPQVELPSARQPTNATDTMSTMILSDQSAMSTRDAEDGTEKGRQASGQKAGPARIQCKQAGAEQAPECMVTSGDLGSQASSITEALLMSPRSLSSMTASPVAPGALAPSTCPSHKSPPSPFPLSPLSPVASAKPAHRDAPVRCSLDRSVSHAGLDRMSTARLRPDLGPAGGVEVEAVNGEKWAMRPPNRALASLHVPFKAVALQQLANALLTSKKAHSHSMDEVVRQAGTAGTAGASDRAATAAWRLFEPMQIRMSAQPKVVTTADQGLAESIAGAMCEMTDCAEMAMLWIEVLQEVESHWRSGRSLPAQDAPAATHAHLTTLQTCFSSMAAALACRQRSVHDAQAMDVDATQQGTQALDTLKQLVPRAVFQDLFAVKAHASLSAAAAAAASATDNVVLQSGVREVQQLANATLSQPVLSQHQLTKLCQVFKKLEVMFQVSVEQQSSSQQKQQQAAWIADVSQQEMHACTPSSSWSDGEDPTWSDLGFESWTLL